MCEGIFGRPRVQLPYGFPERVLQGSACLSRLMQAVSFSTLFHVARVRQGMKMKVHIFERMHSVAFAHVQRSKV